VWACFSISPRVGARRATSMLGGAACRSNSRSKSRISASCRVQSRHSLTTPPRRVIRLARMWTCSCAVSVWRVTMYWLSVNAMPSRNFRPMALHWASLSASPGAIDNDTWYAALPTLGLRAAMEPNSRASSRVSDPDMLVSRTRAPDLPRS
jgi:hypothetical protein